MRHAEVNFTEGNIKGKIEFTQLSPNLPVNVFVDLYQIPDGPHGFHIHEKRLTPKILKDYKDGKISSICDKLGGHFDPYETHIHGNMNGIPHHAGDLINNLIVKNKKVKLNFSDNLISLYDEYINFIGDRSIVIHNEPDDKGIPGYQVLCNCLNHSDKILLDNGRARDIHGFIDFLKSDRLYFNKSDLTSCRFEKKEKQSLITGNAGKRIACGNIIITTNPFITFLKINFFLHQ